jgi:2-polyprenyl-3-methyl-5-hydroxy-6-metoxy-1,4-benzoquinol methylase
MEKIPTLEELNKHYSSYSYSSEGYLSPLTIKSYNFLLDEFEKYRKSNRMLDVGCGRGWFLEEARKRGWEVYGTEYSEVAVELCEKKGINMKKGQLNPDLFDEMDFDVITSFEVIEHINNPNEELNNIQKLLRTGGLFYCTTPNFNSLLRYHLKADYNVICYPEHLSYYTKKTLVIAAKRHKFKKIKFLSTGFSITRLKVSKKTSTEKVVSKQSSDEKLRENINNKWYLGIAKNVINFGLTISNKGMSLKGYFIKK